MKPIAIALFFLLPFHSILVTFLNMVWFGAQNHAPWWMSAWKEIILMMFFLVFFVFIVRFWKTVKANINLLDILIVCFSAFAILWGSVHSENLMQVFLGIKYDLFFLWIFVMARHMALLFPDFFQTRWIEKTVFFSGILVLAFAFLHLFLPTDFLVSLGYFSDPSVDTTNKPASFCQLLENTNECRWQSVLAGPIRFGAFLVLFSAILFLVRIPLFLRNFLLGCVIVALFFTYSRAAWIAEIVFLLLIVFFTFQKSFGNLFWKSFFSQKKVIIALIALFAIFLGLMFFLVFHFENVLLRSGSSSLHWQGIVQSFTVLMQNPMGIGLGMAGAASTHLGESKEFLNENWYLQIFTELGIVGGVLFLILSGIVLHRLLKANTLMFALMGALMIMALFTHVWEEASVAYIVWALAGIFYSKDILENKKKYC